MSTEDWIDQVDETEFYAPHPSVKDTAWIQSMAEYKEQYDKSLEEPEAFWREVSDRFHWSRPWTKLSTHNFDHRTGKVAIEWFADGETNVAYNCLDRHIEAGHGERVAFFFEGNDVSVQQTVTYSQLRDRVNKLANVLRASGVKRGDTVAIYMPMIVEQAVALLACARIGAVHSVVFGGFSSGALSARIIDSKTRVLITADGNFRGQKFINLKGIADEAVKLSAEGGVVVDCVLVARNVGDAAPVAVHMREGRDVWLCEATAGASTECDTEWVNSEHPLFVLYTSGSTGTPKGVIHSTGGYMVWASNTHKMTFDYHEGDVYWCTADIGWITGHSYIVYGPLLNGAVSVLFEGIPTYPDAGRFWDMVDRYQVKQFYTAPTAIRALMRYGDSFVTKYKRTSLAILGTVGEPINPEAWRWYYDVVGNGTCSVVDTWWQTETGGHMLTPLPGCTPMKPGSATLPMLGVEPVVLDKDGNELSGKCEGFLAIKRSWPGQMRTVYNNYPRFVGAYFERFPGYYFSGDGCRRDQDGFYWITGRVDDVMNVSGHRIGTAEVESAIVSHASVAEAAVVSVPHDLKGESLYAFVVLGEGVAFTKELQQEMRLAVRTTVGAFAAPDTFQHATSGLPKTRSGKIMRRILRKIARQETEHLGDVSTLSDSQCIEDLIASGPKE
eukprot:TRINITY_DN5491_c1_g1_i1.p1 TRINITY_DN5491_c1_g1~~TRINITY_DN5491_c1_g1_i1.p1  ORF type:complete len:689 (+),score=197.22 TRINITY_DN5491_c1_g1_i1:62-2068(+)